jgi:hypothetical protein
MASCFAISESREEIYISYLNEPILAEACRKYAFTVDVYIDIIKELIDLSKNCSINVGDSGEIIARFVLLTVLDSFYINNDQISLMFPISLYDYLLRLNIDVENADPIFIKLSKSHFIMFNHFSILRDSCKNLDSTMRQLYVGCTAGIMKKNLKGIDCAIPLLSLEGDAVGTFRIQIKSYAKGTKLDNTKAENVLRKLAFKESSSSKDLFNFGLLYQIQNFNILPDGFHNTYHNKIVKYTDSKDKDGTYISYIQGCDMLHNCFPITKSNEVNTLIDELSKFSNISNYFYSHSDISQVKALLPLLDYNPSEKGTLEEK